MPWERLVLTTSMTIVWVLFTIAAAKMESFDNRNQVTAVRQTSAAGPGQSLPDNLCQGSW